MPAPEFDFYAHAFVNYQALKIDTAEYLLQVRKLQIANFKLGQDVQIKTEEAALMQQAFNNCQVHNSELYSENNKLLKKVIRNRWIALGVSSVAATLGGIVYVQNR